MQKFTREEQEYADAIEEDLEDWYATIPNGEPEGWNSMLEEAYSDSVPKTNIEVISMNMNKSTPEEWRDFLKKIEEDLSK